MFPAPTLGLFSSFRGQALHPAVAKGPCGLSPVPSVAWDGVRPFWNFPPSWHLTPQPMGFSAFAFRCWFQRLGFLWETAVGPGPGTQYTALHCTHSTTCAHTHLHVCTQLPPYSAHISAHVPVVPAPQPYRSTLACSQNFHVSTQFHMHRIPAASHRHLPETSTCVPVHSHMSTD